MSARDEKVLRAIGKAITDGSKEAARVKVDTSPLKEAPITPTSSTSVSGKTIDTVNEDKINPNNFVNGGDFNHETRKDKEKPFD